MCTKEYKSEKGKCICTLLIVHVKCCFQRSCHIALSERGMVGDVYCSKHTTKKCKTYKKASNRFMSGLR